MNYYEELGLSPRATEAEVRRSYKRLTLLLHPDQHQDPEIRALAEAQMKRLNEMVAILTDPDQRRNYNILLLKTEVNVRQMPPQKRAVWFWHNRGWLLVSAAFLLFLVAALFIPAFDSARPLAKTEAGVLKPTLTRLGTEPPVRRTVPTTGRRNKPTQSGRVPGVLPSSERPWKGASRSATLPAEVAPSILAVPLPPALSGPTLFEPSPLPIFPTAPAAGKAGAAAESLAGKWVYTPDPNDLQDPKSFPAEYVEISVVVADDRLRGNYRSRYKLSDRNLSPYASFTFDGPLSGTWFIWKGDGGAEGQVTLRLQSPETMQVNWFATKMGSQLSLGSGAATVYRFR